jgi:FAD synthase
MPAKSIITAVSDRIIIFFMDWIRNEKKFENLSALREQLIIDRARVLEILK